MTQDHIDACGEEFAGIALGVLQVAFYAVIATTLIAWIFLAL